ncbi:TIGR04283 family arsenosugar biosynthesis glycosyltransferase [Minwuia sp.]|uniref:TIGR04283 family arsenosugar biosynthesis glycosyltransferase n=1 Tax=Minwuia sp. TaxID=2493630 RepID=UPI003A952F6D
MTKRLTVIVPALNAEAGLARTLESIDGSPVTEVIVVDGGSTDATRTIAGATGATIIDAPRGRGTQLRAGAEAAQGDWLLFLHADTVLSPSWRAEAGNFMAMPANERRAAAFTFRLDSRKAEARRVERLVNWRCRKLGLPYGDQGLLISRQLYGELGEYPDVPLMEDVALVRRIGRKRMHLFDATATTSAEKFERDGWTARPARNITCLILYFLGMPPRWIARLYGR